MEHLNAKSISLTAIFAALYYVMSYLPGIPAIGVPGVKIQLEACMASVFGLILGPYLGALATLVGVFVAWALPPGSMSVTGLAFLPSPVINAFLVGLIYKGRWRMAFAILAPLIAVFWLLPPAQPIEQNFIVGVAAMWDKILALLLIAPTAVLMKRTFEVPSGESEESEKIRSENKKRIDWPFILSILSAILILANAYMIAINSDVLRFQFEFQNEVYKFKFGYKEIVRVMAPYGYLWLLIGIGILASALIFQIKPEYKIFCGGVITALSGVSAFIGGGFVAGLLLGVMGGLFTLVKARVTVFKASNVEFLIYFLLAFIGNEADNAWGNDIFAVPAVYEGIFQMPLEFVRWAFLFSPYAYFVIRLIQAVIAALIALPLINNLRAAGLTFTKPLV